MLGLDAIDPQSARIRDVVLGEVLEPVSAQKDTDPCTGPENFRVRRGQRIQPGIEFRLQMRALCATIVHRIFIGLLLLACFGSVNASRSLPAATATNCSPADVY